MKEQTLCIIKPDAVANHLIGKVVAMIEASGLKIEAMKMVTLSKDDAKRFYEVHKDRPFYDSLTTFMSSGPAVAIKLSGENAVAEYRKLMGATDYTKAEPKTIRRYFAESIERNVVHGSDSAENAAIELKFFFA